MFQLQAGLLTTDFKSPLSCFISCHNYFIFTQEVGRAIYLVCKIIYYLHWGIHVCCYSNYNVYIIFVFSTLVCRSCVVNQCSFVYLLVFLTIVVQCKFLLLSESFMLLFSMSGCGCDYKLFSNSPIARVGIWLVVMMLCQCCIWPWFNLSFTVKSLKYLMLMSDFSHYYLKSQIWFGKSKWKTQR